jgi:hypothetical protein
MLTIENSGHDLTWTKRTTLNLNTLNKVYIQDIKTVSISIKQNACNFRHSGVSFIVLHDNK